MQKAKETASNIAASAKAGMDKTKATVQEKVEKMTAHDPVEKEMATERKQDKINEAEWNKQEMRTHNAASRQAGSIGTGTAVGDTFNHSATGPTGHVPQGVTGTTHPIGTNTATGRAGNPNTGMGDSLI